MCVCFPSDQRVARAVDGVSYEIANGETVCLVGESGCGKTVSALAIMGLVDCPPATIPEGEIWFKGKDLLRCTEKELERIRGREISMVFQEPMTSLNPVFTIGNQIEEVILTHENASRKQARSRAIELLKDVGMPSPEQRVGDYPHNLSGGQRQRVMIAMALACGPALIIADEPTTALDVTVQAQILSLFRGLQKKHAMAVLLITHNLGVVAEIADRVYIMYAGAIVETGTVNQLFTDPLHPYTMGLLAALPSRSRKGTPLYSISGSVPDPAYKPAGCSFHPRCPYVRGSCRDTAPDMCDFEQGHRARCPVTHRLWQHGNLPVERHKGVAEIKKTG